MKDGSWRARSVLNCGSPLPLSTANVLSHAYKSSRELARSKTWRCFAALLLFAAALSTPAFAQTYAIDWFTIDGGGGTSTGGVFSVSGTIGQPDAGHMSGGNYTLDGGFWGIIAAVQTPGAPLLTIRLTATNTVAVSWPSPSSGFMLQQNTNGVATVNWSNILTVPNDDGTTKTVIVNPPTGNRFYRLKQ